MTLGSLLFVPGAARTELEAAMRSGADAVVADWEDLVPHSDKERARIVTADVFGSLGAARPCRLVRVNHPDERVLFEADTAGLRTVAVTGIVVPKADPAALDSLVPLRLPLYPVIESAQGVRLAYELAAHVATAAVLIGLADLAASLGVEPDPRAVLPARVRVQLDVKAAGRPVIDVPFVGSSGFREQAIESRALGFDGRICRRVEHVDACSVFSEPRTAPVEA